MASDSPNKAPLSQLLTDSLSSDAAQNIKQSWYGRWIGQATTAVALFAGYVLVIAALLRFAKDEIFELYREHVWLFLLLFVGPLLLIFFLSLLPALLKRYRERRLFSLAMNPESKASSYFRLTPYEESDRVSYERTDGADSKILNWLSHSNSPVSYLSGVSGSGKSSLVRACVVPILREVGWNVHVVRGMASPAEELRELLVDSTNYVKPAGDQPSDLYELLCLCSKHEDISEDRPLLLILDQFEEFLILDGAEDKSKYADLLARIQRDPIDNVILLHVLREDYRWLIYDLNLPKFIPGISGFELAAYAKKDARAFLSQGPFAMNDDAYMRLFEGLDSVESTKGLYRPITLNMIGHVMEREGQGAQIDPATLIENYLKRCIVEGYSKDHSKPILDLMITPAGTKCPMEISELARLTGISDAFVAATLVDLQSDGLVRPLLNRKWEISHDFIASLLGRMLGKIKEPFVKKYAEPILMLSALVWLGTIAVAMPIWVHSQALDALFSRGLAREAGHNSGTGFSAIRPYAFEIRGLSELKKREELFDVTALDMSSVSQLSNLEVLDGLPSLRDLNIAFTENLRDLSGIERLTGLVNLSAPYSKVGSIDRIDLLGNLEFLNLTGVEAFDNLEEFSELENLKYLYVGQTSRLSSLSGAAALDGLERLSLENSKNLTELQEISGLLSLQWLDLSENPQLSSVEELGALASLTELNLSGNTGLLTLNGLERLRNLSTLNLSNASRLTSLRQLGELAGLRRLELEGLRGISDLRDISGLNELGFLSLRDSKGLKSLSGIEKLNGLFNIDLSGAEDLSDISSIAGLSSLAHLNLSYSGNVSDFSALGNLEALVNLNLEGTFITELLPLSGLQDLSHLNLKGATKLESLSGIERLQSLRTLNLSETVEVKSLSGLTRLVNLETLSLSDASGIDSIEPLFSIPNLRTLDISGATKIQTLKGVESLQSLERLILKDARSLVSLEGIEHLSNLRVLDLRNVEQPLTLFHVNCGEIGTVLASEELLATCGDKPEGLFDWLKAISGWVRADTASNRLIES